MLERAPGQTLDEHVEGPQQRGSAARRGAARSTGRVLGRQERPPGEAGGGGGRRQGGVAVPRPARLPPRPRRTGRRPRRRPWSRGELELVAAEAPCSIEPRSIDSRAARTLETTADRSRSHDAVRASGHTRSARSSRETGVMVQREVGEDDPPLPAGERRAIEPASPCSIPSRPSSRTRTVPDNRQIPSNHPSTADS